jgi:hypothetical protein
MAASRSVGGRGSAAQRRPAAGSAAIIWDSSISAIGLPAAWASTCSRARPRGGCGWASSSRPASWVLSGFSSKSGKSRSKPAGGRFPRAPSSSTSGSDSKRRAAKASVSREPRSSHWASSATTSRGRFSDSLDSRVSTASPVSRASADSGSAERPNAPSSASACRPGRSATRSSTGRSSWCSPANARSCSDSRPVTCSTRSPADLACRTASASNTVLPMPASPSSISTRLSGGGGATSPRNRDSSLSRPISPVFSLANPEPLTPSRAHYRQADRASRR